MTTFVALLRAVNVSGQNKIPMAELRRGLGGLGLTAVETHLQSGNVVFDARGDDSAEQAAAIHGLIERDFGHDVRVLVLTAACSAESSPRASNTTLPLCRCVSTPVSPRPPRARHSSAMGILFWPETFTARSRATKVVIGACAVLYC